METPNVDTCTQPRHRTIRGVPDQVWHVLKVEAAKADLSLTALVARILAEWARTNGEQ